MRIISLSPSLTEMVIALKASQDLVGMSDACEASENHFQRVGNPKALELSTIDALSPEWVLADSQDNRPEEIGKIQERWKIKVFDIRTLANVCDTVTELGGLLEKKKEARDLSELIQKEIQTNRKTFQVRKKKRTVLLLWDAPFLTVNCDTYASRLVEDSGGENVFRDEPLREFPVEMEDLVEKEPEMLLLSGKPAPFQPKHVAAFHRYRVFSKIPIHLVDRSLFRRYGLETVKALQYFRTLYSGVS